MGENAHNFQDLTGMRFGKLTVLRLAKERSDKKTRWECKCDCGNTIEVLAYSLKTTTRSCGCDRIEDLTGKRFGMLTVLKLDDKRTSSRGEKWICKCDCGKIKSINRSSLIRGATTSCGCKRLVDLTGQRFGRLIVLSRESGSKWKCLCDCGNEIIASGSNLKSGNTTSCGCYAKECIGKVNLIHGGSNSSLFSVWADMRSRCTNNNRKCYKYYGGRGIKVCTEWEDFENFRKWSLENGYEPGLSIDRIDVNGDYCPDNCRWATKEIQANNTRVNVYLTISGETLTAAQWSKKYGLCESTVCWRHRHGWSDEECVFGRKRKSSNNEHDPQ